MFLVSCGNASFQESHVESSANSIAEYDSLDQDSQRSQGSTGSIGGNSECAVPHEICLPSDKLNEFGGTFHARTQKI